MIPASRIRANAESGTSSYARPGAAGPPQGASGPVGGQRGHEVPGVGATTFSGGRRWLRWPSALPAAPARPCPTPHRG
ncbi:hypothetical protein EJO68_10900 [Variovorax atrisoli]|nr:hypothetical protein EJO68_10900 [Variovorax sp. 369]